MFDINTIVMFCTASVLLALAPGPDNLYVMSQSMLKGRSAGIMITLGLGTGLIGHTTAVALGVAVLFQTSSVAFMVLKFAGAAYLLYLAWKSFSASKGTLQMQKGTEANSWYLYRRGVIMNITNPKVSIFFLAFSAPVFKPFEGVYSAPVDASWRNVYFVGAGGFFVNQLSCGHDRRMVS